MNNFHLIPLVAIMTLAPLTTSAGYQGSISFSPEEIATHDQGVDRIVSSAAACLQRDLDHHRTFFQRYGFSPYYGDRGSFGKLSYEGKREYLRESGFNPALLSQMQPISCVELMLNCLGEGFNSANAADFWQRIRQFTILNGVDGMATQYALEKLGWKTLYWNPDTRLNRQWDSQEREHNPSNSDRFWGYHEEYWQSVQHEGRYLYNVVDDFRRLSNFGATSPEFLKPIPFFVGTAHGGYHVFPGTYGRVVEAHSTKAITDPKSLQSASFNPLAGLAPTDGMYHSGLITVPGKYLR